MDNKKEINKEVYVAYGRGLGDCWLSISHILNLAIKENKTFRIALWYPKGNKIRRVDKIKEMVPLFKHSEMLEVGEWEPTRSKIPWNKLSTYPFVPTKITWKPNNSKKICYQFDAKSSKGQKFSSQKEQDKIISEVKKLGYETIRLGWGMSLKECVIALSECELIIGVDSGIPHVAASVGTPIFYCQNDRDYNAFGTLHSNKHFILAKDYKEIIKCVSQYKEEGLKYYKNNAWNIKFFKGE